MRNEAGQEADRGQPLPGGLQVRNKAGQEADRRQPLPGGLQVREEHEGGGAGGGEPQLELSIILGT